MIIHVKLISIIIIISKIFLIKIFLIKILIIELIIFLKNLIIKIISIIRIVLIIKNRSSENFNNKNNIDNFSKNLNDINNTDNLSKDINNINNIYENLNSINNTNNSYNNFGNKNNINNNNNINNFSENFNKNNINKISENLNKNNINTDKPSKNFCNDNNDNIVSKDVDNTISNKNFSSIFNEDVNNKNSFEINHHVKDINDFVISGNKKDNKNSLQNNYSLLTKINEINDKKNYENSVIKNIDISIENTVKNFKSVKEITIHEIAAKAPTKIRNKLKFLLLNNINVLALDTDDLGKSKLLSHKIKIISGRMPIKQRMYRVANKKQMSILREEISKLLRNGLIEPSKSSWSFPVILVPKKNGKWRMVVDYRKLNDITIKDAYPLPYIEEILFSIGNKVKYLTTLDLFSGFHQIPMEKEDRDKTCFTTMFGNYNYKVMPFGLCNAPATFQREMNRIFLPLIGKCMFIYMDDLVIFSDTLEQHILDLQKVFDIIKENGLKANLSKCHFIKQEVEVLGHILSTEGIKPVPKKVDVISKWESPKNITQLRSFLGAIGYYRKFIKDFAIIAQPLFKLLKKNIKYIWDDITEERFKILKEKLIEAPILKYPDYDKQFLIRTDASLDGIGGVLMQKDKDNIEHPIQYISRSLKPTEINYSITDLEGTAAYYCCLKFKPYFSGNKYDTILYTDHKPLIGLFNNKEPNNARQARWVITFSMLKIVVKYEQGKKNVIADALSRLIPDSKNINKEIKNNTLFIHLNNNENINYDSIENINRMNNTNKNDYPLNNISEENNYVNFNKNNLDNNIINSLNKLNNNNNNNNYIFKNLNNNSSVNSYYEKFNNNNNNNNNDKNFYLENFDNNCNNSSNDIKNFSKEFCNC